MRLSEQYNSPVRVKSVQRSRLSMGKKLFSCFGVRCDEIQTFFGYSVSTKVPNIILCNLIFCGQNLFCLQAIIILQCDWGSSHALIIIFNTWYRFSPSSSFWDVTVHVDKWYECNVFPTTSILYINASYFLAVLPNKSPSLPSALGRDWLTMLLVVAYLYCPTSPTLWLLSHHCLHESKLLLPFSHQECSFCPSLFFHPNMKETKKICIPCKVFNIFLFLFSVLWWKYI